MLTNNVQSKYAAYLPVYDNTTKFPPTELFEHHDRGHDADPTKSNLLPKGESSVKATKLTPRVGTEITGLQLSQLSDIQKNELALLVAERGVVVFRDQDFKDIGPEKQKEFGQYFGRLHVHVSYNSESLNCTNTGLTAGRRACKGPHRVSLYLSRQRQLVPPRQKHNEAHYDRVLSRPSVYFMQILTPDSYHSDVSYEHQPPAITLLTLVQVPETGGDTAWTSQVAAYDRLSEPFKLFLEGLRAEHSGFEQAEKARRDGHHVRREPVKSYHPIVRVHPVTKQKALFVNRGFTRRIVGLKDEESEAILKLLYQVCPPLSLTLTISLREKC